MIGKSKYRKVTDWIQDRISRGELLPGDKLESENEISAFFHISRQTVRHALGILESQGILSRVRGSGTFVKGQAPAVQKSEGLSRTVSIVSTYIDGYIFPRILKEMVRILEKEGYSVRLLYTENHVEKERQLLERMLSEESREPLIAEPVMSGLPNPNLVYYRELRKKGIPILFFHSEYPELGLPCVRMDDIKAGKMAAEYLISQGHTRIGGIFKADDGQGRKRYQGMVQAMYQAGIEVREDRICWIDTQDLRNPEYMDRRIRKRLENCTACVCYNDEVAHILTDICMEHGIDIPTDLSVVSIDNSELARLNPVPLTSVAHPMELLGKTAAENMLRMMEAPDFNGTYFFEPELEIRESVCRVKQEEEESYGSETVS